VASYPEVAVWLSAEAQRRRRDTTTSHSERWTKRW
jgi:hypothetical protein